MRIGAHVGVSGGFPSAIDYAREIGAECIQVFAKSPRQWHSRELSETAIEDFAHARARGDITPIITHTAYLINLGSTDDELWDRSVEALADELARAALLGADYVVTHIGTAKQGPAEAAARVAAGITSALAHAPEAAPMLLLENNAGAGHSFGSMPAEFGSVLGNLAPEARDRTALCLDTCHAHAAGFALDTKAGWDTLMEDYSATCGQGLIFAVHANDSMFASGSHRDRHAWIGDGAIGTNGFTIMVSRPELANTCVVTEMPGDVPQKDIVNVGRLKDLRAAAATS